MKILLTYLRYEGDIYMDSYEQDHLGLGYIASVLRQHGHTVYFINAHFLGLSIEELKEKIEMLDFDVIGIPVHVETLFDLYLFSTWLKKRKKVHINTGGHWAATEPEYLLKSLPDVDSVTTGEGELTFLELVETLGQNKSLKDVKGLAWRQADRIFINEKRPLIEDLDTLPYPARDHIETYKTSDWDFKKRTANILASRGCYACCSFCSIHSFYHASPGKKIRFRDPIKIVDEIEWLMREYRVNQIFFSDDNFRAADKIHPNWSRQVAEEIIRRNLDINLILLLRANDIEEDLLKVLKRAGLVGVAIGIESDVERMLKQYDKKTTKQDNRKALQVLRSLRIDPLISFMMFDPYSTLEELKENLNFFREIKYIRYFHYTRPLTLLAGYDLKTYGGTPLTIQVEKEGFKSNSHFSYECHFKDDRVAQVFDLLQKWRIHILKLVMHNPLWLLDMANRLQEFDITYQIHSLSRKFMKLDAMIFDSFIELVERGLKSDDSECRKLIDVNRKKLAQIKKQFQTIELTLEERRKIKNGCIY